MSDNKTIAPSGLPSFKSILQSYSNCEGATQREMAVICALEVVRANTMGGPSHKLKEHLQNLGEYANYIQNALKE
ncbi:hypothetical protein RB979_001751 [Vibrio alginolyticus]|uniref:hypothetical protein n=1 Tax=Vibrio TaxID=662 RepID=UPI0021CF0FD1|nr:hypothetical protein [Vibrio sp. 1731]ELA6779527.1 hypothetical protein [Vibrio alginolyticus]MDW2111919.1 hypothetical protein [Vibrio sp. 1731]